MKFRWLAFVAAIIPLVSAQGQIASNETWRTFRTPHFLVHFTPPVEQYARRIAADAEWAYANLATELKRPRGVINLVITDAIDAANGLASVFPRNRIVMQIRPPVDQTSLQSYDDWGKFLLQHELAHIFHLDRSAGWWGASQRILGRHPFTFPNFYTPAWLTEGLAVYYESRFTDGGRIHGAYQYDVARAAARARHVPRLDELSLARTRYPMGQSAYIYGSFVWDAIAQRHGPESIPAFVEKSSSLTIPYLVNHNAKRVFGETFTSLWQKWRDSVTRTTTAFAAPDSSWRTVKGRRFISTPRWWNDSVIAYTSDNGREPLGLYVVRPGGEPRYVARRKSLDANILRSDGTIVFAQLEYVDRFHLRSDLYESKNGNVRRLTFNKRLSAPDVRVDGEIVAIQSTPGSTRLVRVSRDGKRITVLSEGSADIHWATPRWSPDGTQIAAARIERGTSAIIVLDSTGAMLQTIGSTHGVVRTPVWVRNGNGLIYTSDQSGISRVYYAGVNPYTAPVIIGDASSAGLYDLDVANDSSMGLPHIASTFQHVDGLHLGTWSPSTLAGERELPVGSNIIPRRRTTDRVSSDALANTATQSSSPYDTVRSSPYRPWRSLVPAYWTPVVGNTSSTTGWTVGARTTGLDVIERHSYIAQALVNTKTSKVDALLSYEYGGLLNPLITASAEQDWSYTPVFIGSTVAGQLAERTRLYSVRTSFIRPRMFTYAALVLGAELEMKAYEITPDSLISRLPTAFQDTYQFPTLLASLQFSNAIRPTMSISPEDGVSFSATVRRRWEQGTRGSGSWNTIVVSSFYKSLDLPGFSHHALAFRLAGGLADRRSLTDYSVGGVSGGSLEVLPGFTIGDQVRTFPVRGFSPHTERGTRAWAASLEYRAPISIPSRGVGLIPIFLDRTSLSIFADAGRAYCAGQGAPVCAQSAFGAPALASVGGELNLDAALQYDLAYRFRLGVAVPVGESAKVYRPRAATVYFTLGTSF
jgi:hypothetical protein